LVSQSRSNGQYDVGINKSTSLGLLQSVWSFNFDSRKIFDLTNQTGQTEIGAPGQISASVETFTQKLGHALNWAEKTAYAIAVVIDALRGIGHTIKSVIGSFSAVWADIELAGTFLAGGKGLNPFSDENRSRLQAALEKRNAIVAQSNQNYVDLWDMPLLADAVTAWLPKGSVTHKVFAENAFKLYFE